LKNLSIDSVMLNLSDTTSKFTSNISYVKGRYVYDPSLHLYTKFVMPSSKGSLIIHSQWKAKEYCDVHAVGNMACDDNRCYGNG
jgi:hypothetical protein